jgi:lactate racemase
LASQSCGGGAIRGRGHSRASASQVQDGDYILGGISARQDLLSNNQGDGHPNGYFRARGSLIIASACSEGFGSEEFRAAQRRLIELGPDKFLATLTAKSLADVDEWQTEMQLKPLRVGRISLYTSGLSDEERALTGVETIANLDETIARSIALAEDPCIAVIPEGPYVVPYFHA